MWQWIQHVRSERGINDRRTADTVGFSIKALQEVVLKTKASSAISAKEL